MAEKKTAMGDDPLAWLVADNDVADRKAPRVQPAAGRQKHKAGKAKTLADVDLVEASYADLADQGELIATRFYDYLFSRYPEIKPFFGGVASPGQQKKLLTALVMLVRNLRQPEILSEYLRELGIRHQGYGVKAEDFDKFIKSLLVVMAEFAGEAWTDEVNLAWLNTLNWVKKLMLDAYQSSSAAKPAVVSKAAPAARLPSQQQLEAGLAALLASVRQGVFSERLRTGEYEGGNKIVAEFINSLLDAVQKPVDDCVGMATALAEASSQIAAVALDMSQGNIELSQQSEQQTSALQELAAGIERIAGMQCQSSGDIPELASKVSGGAEQSLAMLRQALNALPTNGSSKNISVQLTALDEIVFQTELMAFNASVEAARAGDQGRASAVIAAELRELSRRAMTVLRETKQLCGDGDKEQPDVLSALQACEHSLQEAVAGAGKVTAALARDAGGSKGQEADVALMVNQVNEMRERNRHNTVLLERATEAGVTIYEQSKKLQRLTAILKAVDDDQAGVAPESG